VARPKTGLTGFLNINKPVGLTSHDVVARVRRWAGQQQVGHGGTLDPQASGVLPVALGPCTRLLEFLPDPKVYEAEVAFGVATDTYDGEGRVTEEHDPSGLTRDQVEAALPAFVGPAVLQHPPAFSAIKQHGQRSYVLARQGELTPPPARPVQVYRIDLLEFTPPQARLRVVCGRGMYVRSLAHDLGVALGCGAHLAGLVRTHSGPFGLETSIDLETLMETPREAAATVVLPGQFPFPHWPSVRLGPDRAARVLQGSQLLLTVADLWPPKPLVVAGVAAPAEQDLCLAYGPDGTVLAIMRRQHGGPSWQPFKVFPPQLTQSATLVRQNT
jgi:tRNA pseudouridine55 synthase